MKTSNFKNIITDLIQTNQTIMKVEYDERILGDTYNIKYYDEYAKSVFEVNEKTLVGKDITSKRVLIYNKEGIIINKPPSDIKYVWGFGTNLLDRFIDHVKTSKTGICFYSFVKEFNHSDLNAMLGLNDSKSYFVTKEHLCSDVNHYLLTFLPRDMNVKIIFEELCVNIYIYSNGESTNILYTTSTNQL